MSRGLSESDIIKALADATANRISRKVIAALQRMHHTLTGDDSGLGSLWDEICVESQYQHPSRISLRGKTRQSKIQRGPEPMKISTILDHLDSGHMALLEFQNL